MKRKTCGPVEHLPIDPSSPWWGEHRARYRYAQAHVRDRQVLDIACGSGFGCIMLSEAKAKFVIGVDIEMEVVVTAQRHLSFPGVRFIRGNGTALPFMDSIFDIVTSFETLEHIADYETFLCEVRRVTSKDGCLVLSTPNALVTTRYPRNPYHIYEFTPTELYDLLSKFYKSVNIYGQFLTPHYRIAPFIPGREHLETVSNRIRLLFWKVGNRLPFRIRDFLAITLTGKHFYPTEADYYFDTNIDNAHVLLAFCHA